MYLANSSVLAPQQLIDEINVGEVVKIERAQWKQLEIWGKTSAEEEIKSN